MEFNFMANRDLMEKHGSQVFTAKLVERSLIIIGEMIIASQALKLHQELNWIVLNSFIKVQEPMFKSNWLTHSNHLLGVVIQLKTLLMEM